MAADLMQLITGILSNNPFAVKDYTNSVSVGSALDSLSSGEMTAEEFLSQVAKNGWNLTPEQESYLSSMLSNQRTNEARAYETQMANTELLRMAPQLEALGLGPSNVYQTGGASTPNVAAASSPMINNANQRYDRMSSLANSLIGMAGRMASSGIYGSSLMAVKNAAAKAANMASHSASVVNYYNKYGQKTGSVERTDVRSHNPYDTLKFI